jgi:hypothetical protein
MPRLILATADSGTDPGKRPLVGRCALAALLIVAGRDGSWY